MALVDRDAILKDVLPQLASDDPAEARRLLKAHLRKRYGSIWLLILAPLISELVKMLIERWRNRHPSEPVSAGRVAQRRL